MKELMTDFMSIINTLLLVLQKQTVLFVEINQYVAVALAQLRQLIKSDNPETFFQILRPKRSYYGEIKYFLIYFQTSVKLKSSSDPIQGSLVNQIFIRTPQNHWSNYLWKKLVKLLMKLIYQYYTRSIPSTRVTFLISHRQLGLKELKLDLKIMGIK